MGTLFRQTPNFVAKVHKNVIFLNKILIMGTLFRQTPNNGYPFPPKWPLKMGTGLAASAAHPRRNQIWVPPPPPPGELLFSVLQTHLSRMWIFNQKKSKQSLQSTTLINFAMLTQVVSWSLFACII